MLAADKTVGDFHAKALLDRWSRDRMPPGG
jgi:hypothetical protein